MVKDTFSIEKKKKKQGQGLLISKKGRKKSYKKIKKKFKM